MTGTIVILCRTASASAATQLTSPNLWASLLIARVPKNIMQVFASVFSVSANERYIISNEVFAFVSGDIGDTCKYFNDVLGELHLVSNPTDLDEFVMMPASKEAIR